MRWCSAIACRARASAAALTPDDSGLATRRTLRCRAMSVRWRKLGRVYRAAGEAPWRQSHAFLPTTLALDGERIRVYVAFLDAGSVGRVGWVDVDARDPTRVIAVSEQPALDAGAP